jgi:hypothetical protein
MKSSLRFAASLALALSAAAATACKHEEQAPPLPEGLLLSGESDDVQRILARFASLSGTPIAEAATAARARTASCTTVEARSTAGFAALFAALACDETPAFQARREAGPVRAAPAG